MPHKPVNGIVAASKILKSPKQFSLNGTVKLKHYFGTSDPLSKTIGERRVLILIGYCLEALNLALLFAMHCKTFWRSGFDPVENALVHARIVRAGH